MPQTDVELDAEFTELIAEIEEKAARVREHLVKVEAEREELMARLRRYDGAISRLKPQAKKVVMSKRSGAAQEQAVEFTQRYMLSHRPSLSDGFTAAELHRQMNANGEGSYGKERIRYAVNELHERGLIRLDRRTVGGGKLYKLVEAK